MKPPKLAALLLVLVFVASNLALVESAAAQMAPEFTFEKSGSYLMVTIKNQPFTPVSDSGHTVRLYYYFKITALNASADYPDFDRRYGKYSGEVPDTSASDTEYTRILIPISSSPNDINGHPYVPLGSDVKVQVQAIKGYIDIVEFTGMLAGNFYGFVGDKSSWSEPQTLHIEPSPTPATTKISTTPKPLSSIAFSLSTDVALVIVAVIAVAALLVAVLSLFYRRLAKT